MKKKIIVPIGTPRKSNGNIIILKSVYVSVEADIEKLIEELQNIKDEYSDEYENLQIVTERDCGCRHDCYCSPSYYVCGRRLETDIEEEFREIHEKEFAERQLKQKQAQFEKLKKELGK